MLAERVGVVLDGRTRAGISRFFPFEVDRRVFLLVPPPM